MPTWDFMKSLAFRSLKYTDKGKCTTGSHATWPLYSDCVQPLLMLDWIKCAVATLNITVVLAYPIACHQMCSFHRWMVVIQMVALHGQMRSVYEQPDLMFAVSCP
jgi:hypothetical protein